MSKSHSRVGSNSKHGTNKNSDSLVPSENWKSVVDVKKIKKTESVKKMPVLVDAKAFISSQFITVREDVEKERKAGKELLSLIQKTEEKSFQDFEQPTLLELHQFVV